MAASVTLYGILAGGSTATEVTLLTSLTYPFTIQSGIPYHLPSDARYVINYDQGMPGMLDFTFENNTVLMFSKQVDGKWICVYDIYNRSTLLNKLVFTDQSYQFPAIVRAAYLQNGSSYRILMEVNEPYSVSNSISNVFVNGVSYSASLYTQAQLANGNTVYRTNTIPGTASPATVTYKRGSYTSAPVTTIPFGDAPTVTVTAVTSSSITILITSGTYAFPVSSYSVLESSDNGQSGENVTIASNGTNPVSFTYTNVNIGVGYQFRAITNTQAGSSLVSAVQPFTIVNVPTKPTGVSVVAGDGQAEVSFTASSENGAGPILQYKVYNAVNNTLLSYGASSPITVTGLTNGTSYSVYVTAVNAIGESVGSDGSTLFTPIGAGAPCFFGNAPVLTPSGYKRMDSLKVGDKVVTANGTAASIQHVEITICKAGKHSNPYVLEKGVFGATERVFISPDHKIAQNGKMVKAKYLNLEREEMTGMLKYYNIAIEGSVNMIVAGVEVESLSPITHTAITVEQLVDVLQRKYGSKLTSEEITNKVLRTCRILKDGRVEVPIMRKV